MKRTFAVLALGLATLLTGCGQINEGNVGVRTELGGSINQKPITTGFYLALMSSVDEYTTKETSVQLENLTPRAADNLYLKELDTTVYYQTDGARVPAFVSQKANMSAQLQGDDSIRPGYRLIEDLAKATFMDEVSKFDSLVIHQKREKLEQAVKARLQSELDETAPGLFRVTRIVVRSVQTDPSIEDSIRRNVTAQKDLDTAKKQTQIKEEQAKGNLKVSSGLTPEVLQYEYIQTLKACASSSGCTLIVDGSGSAKMLNVAK